MTLSRNQKIIVVVTVLAIIILLGVNIKAPPFLCSFYGVEMLCLSESHPLWFFTKYRLHTIAAVFLIGLALFVSKK